MMPVIYTSLLMIFILFIGSCKKTEIANDLQPDRATSTTVLISEQNKQQSNKQINESVDKPSSKIEESRSPVYYTRDNEC